MSLETAAIDLDGYDRAANRRAELAAAALTTLAQRGYARTSLREIAANSPYSHGIFHYYFESKDDLILECVRTYQDSCVANYDDMVARCRTPEQLRSAFSERLGGSLQRCDADVTIRLSATSTSRPVKPVEARNPQQRDYSPISDVHVKTPTKLSQR